MADSFPHSDVSERYALTLSCLDQPGIVHAVSGALVAAGGNITESQQYGSPSRALAGQSALPGQPTEGGSFFMRVEATASSSYGELHAALKPVAEAFSMDWALHRVGTPVRTLILASKEAHCLNELLFQQRSGQLPIEVPAIVSNHTDLAELAAFYGIPFHHVPVTAATKDQAEQTLRELAEEHSVELVVLARYMQILSNDLCRDLEGRAINIHHSFLPSFKGARPYAQAHARGVKLIGATAHYVTADLDEGPIIEQEVIRVDHAHTPERLARMGRAVEARTLAQAVQWHAEHRVLLDGHRTVVFAG
ncbi:formyltetrahydrofolate deformylase [Psychromicrobium xiongbiense]|uniref:formyltetrahydrofolate deformylase n=1 Tax=Psychromicrobium xiongbiense TaxID=3051184 RepID=UPI002553A96C|nr:formyltetrahydrofolate deformylase [Psychromicrobium sp. YIM S02556]